MKRFFSMLLLLAALASAGRSNRAGARKPQEKTASYLGFDRNIYPGDDAISVLRHTFVFTSYWLGPPPGEKTSTWKGKREFLQSQGFGFLILYPGRESGELKDQKDAKQKGSSDASDAAEAAKVEGFAPGTIIFLDIEEGGRLPDSLHAYLHAWFAEIVRSGFRAGVYCSGIPVREGPGTSITTADDVRTQDSIYDITFWVYNDVCPTSPGCTFGQAPPLPSRSGISFAAVWQYAQSPRRKEFTRKCAATYGADGNCYAPRDLAHHWFLDLNSAGSADPSGGRRAKEKASQ
jgi:hypothetical protein